MAKDRQPDGSKYWTPWNVWYGCTPVGQGCKNCWAKQIHEQRRTGVYIKAKRPRVYSHPFSEVHVFGGRLNIPLFVKTPTRFAFCFSSDPFHPDVPFEMLDQAFAVMALCPQHTFIVLTKRWERMAEYMTRRKLLPGGTMMGGQQPWKTSCDDVYRIVRKTIADAPLIWPLPNVWLGVSVSTQAELGAAMPHLLATPAAVRVLSLEPLLEEMDLAHVQFYDGTVEVNCLTGDHGVIRPHRGRSDKRIGWVIVGCESGPNRRPCKWTWVRDIVEQCRSAGVPVFVKQVAKASGPVLKDPAEWPESIRVRELPG